MEPIDLKRLEEAVILFYRSTSQEQAVTHDWLTKVQTSPQAWSFSWELMKPEKPQEVQFFGAVTLHSKLMKFWHEIPSESRNELKQKLLETIVSYANGPKLVLNRLCISLSAFVVHMLTEWNTAIEDVINIFQNQQIPNVSPNMQLWIVLEVLQGIPEETNAIYTSVKRVVLRGELAKKAQIVIKTIEDYLEHQFERQWTEEDFSNLTRAVKCVASWIKNIGYQIDNCIKISTLLLKIINKCYWRCIHEEGSDGCMSADENELSETCIKCLISIMIQPESHHYQKTALTLITMFLDSLTDITKSEYKEENTNEDIAVNIYTLFLSSVERHSQLLLKGITSTNPDESELFRRIANEIMQCTDRPGIYPVEESCSTLAMGFWYMLQDEVFSIRDPIEKNKCWDVIKYLYSHLTRILVKKAQQPDELAIESWTPDDLETFRCYRQDIADTLLYCCEVLDSAIFDILSSILDETIKELQLNTTSWTKLEACIFALHSVADNVDTAENNHIPKLMRILSEIPYDKMNDKLLGCALEAVGAYCLWFKRNNNYIALAIDLLVKGLNSNMSSQATLGLKDICRDCQLELKPYVEPLLDACQASLQSGHLKNSECVRLMFSVGKLMSMLSASKIPSYLDTIVSPCFEELQIICQNGIKSEPAKIRTIFRLNMISTLFSSLNTDVDDDENIDEGGATLQPVLVVMEKTMPIFRQIVELWIQSPEVLETSCNALKHAVTNLKSDFKPMIQDLCYFIVSILQNNCCPPVLELSRVVIIIFYKDTDCKELMQQLFVETISHTLNLFERTPENGFSDISDIIESFYGFNLQLLKKFPISYINPQIDLNKLLLYALKAITLPENGPIRHGIQFISHLILESRNYPDMNKIIQQQGSEIIRTSILCIACITPRAQIEKFADIFLNMNKKYPCDLIVWMKILGTPNFPTPLIDNVDKERFMAQIIREKVNKRLTQTYLNEFAAKARGLVDKI